MVTPTVHMGLPSPGTDFIEFSLNLNDHLIKNPISTFLMDLQTNALARYGIFKNDILVVDKSVPITNRSFGVFCGDGEFKIKTLAKVLPQDIFWGTVTGVVRKLI